MVENNMGKGDNTAEFDFETIIMWENSQWLGKNIVWTSGIFNSWKAWIGALTTFN